MTRRFLRFRLAGPLLVGLVAALLAATAEANGAQPSSSHSLTSATGSVVPLVVCPTKFGAPSGPHGVFPSLTTLSISTPLARSLAAYTDSSGQMTVTGPRDWKCSAQIGADGSEGLTVVPKARTGALKHEGITAGETSACYGCTTGQACALFPAAARAFAAAYNQPCPAHRPRRESVYRISKTVIGFEDPPYVKGEGAFSGGVYPANGVMTYIPASNDGSWIETCTLPATVHSTCTAILNDFLAKYRTL